jgi:hypothetical protein
VVQDDFEGYFVFLAITAVAVDALDGDVAFAV